MDILETMTLAQLREKIRAYQLVIDEAYKALADGRRGDAIKTLHAYSTPPGRKPFHDRPDLIA